MEPAVLESVCRLIEESGYSGAVLSWQGGEPLLLGASGLETYLANSSRLLKKAGIRCWHSIHTNGALLNRELTTVFLEFGVAVGVSVDGYYEVHSEYRSTPGGSVSFNSVLEAIEQLIEAGVYVEVTSTLASPQSIDVERLYGFFRSLRVARINVEPCLVHSPDSVCIWGSLWLAPYVDLMISLYEKWSSDSEARRPPIAYFSELTGTLRGGRPESCHLSGECSNHITIEPTGDVYPCDHFAGLRRFRLGNVTDTPEIQLGRMQRASASMTAILEARRGCPECRWLEICNGGCPYQRLSEAFVVNYPAQCQRSRLFAGLASRL
jgi:uncharacterized protein